MHVAVDAGCRQDQVLARYRVGKAEAIRLAKKRLREKNTQEYTASLKVVGDVSLVAGITVKLKGFQQFDKKYKVTQAKHNLLDGYTVDLSLKQVLEGY